MTCVRTALVIGGGIAGPVTAMALRKAGIEAIVYEARPARADASGAFLTLASNGIEALRVLDADRRALATAFPTPVITLRDARGRRLGEVPIGHAPGAGTTSHTMKRADLYDALHDEALARDVRIEHGRRLVDARDTGDGVHALFDDGSHTIGDLLIGCDGVHSTVRRIIDPAAPAPTYAGLVGTGGYARGACVDSAPGSYEMIFGKRAFFGYTAAPDGKAWWFANLPRRDEPTRGELTSIGGDEWRARLLELYAHDAGPAVELIAASAQILPMSAMHSIPRLPTWHSGRMIVVGDAAHAPTPSSGQGASLAIEDGVVLAKCLLESATPVAAFASFEAARRPRVEQIIKWAKRTNNSKVAGPVGRALRDAVLPPILKLTANGRAHRQIYDHHIEWALQEDDGWPSHGRHR